MPARRPPAARGPPSPRSNQEDGEVLTGLVHLDLADGAAGTRLKSPRTPGAATGRGASFMRVVVTGSTPLPAGRTKLNSEWEFDGFAVFRHPVAAATTADARRATAASDAVAVATAAAAAAAADPAATAFLSEAASKRRRVNGAASSAAAEKQGSAKKNFVAPNIEVVNVDDADDDAADKSAETSGESGDKEWHRSIGLVVSAASEIERVLTKNYSASGAGLMQKARDVRYRLPGEGVFRLIQFISRMRNTVAHCNGMNPFDTAEDPQALNEANFMNSVAKVMTALGQVPSESTLLGRELLQRQKQQKEQQQQVKQQQQKQQKQQQQQKQQKEQQQQQPGGSTGGGSGGGSGGRGSGGSGSRSSGGGESGGGGGPSSTADKSATLKRSAATSSGGNSPAPTSQASVQACIDIAPPPFYLSVGGRTHRVAFEEASYHLVLWPQNDFASVEAFSKTQQPAAAGGDGGCPLLSGGDAVLDGTRFALDWLHTLVFAEVLGLPKFLPQSAAGEGKIAGNNAVGSGSGGDKASGKKASSPGGGAAAAVPANAAAAAAAAAVPASPCREYHIVPSFVRAASVPLFRDEGKGLLWWGRRPGQWLSVPLVGAFVATQQREVEAILRAAGSLHARREAARQLRGQVVLPCFDRKGHSVVRVDDTSTAALHQAEAGVRSTTAEDLWRKHAVALSLSGTPAAPMLEVRGQPGAGAQRASIPQLLGGFGGDSPSQSESLFFAPESCVTAGVRADVAHAGAMMPLVVRRLRQCRYLASLPVGGVLPAPAAAAAAAAAPAAAAAAAPNVAHRPPPFCWLAAADAAALLAPVTWSGDKQLVFVPCVALPADAERACARAGFPAAWERKQQQPEDEGALLESGDIFEPQMHEKLADVAARDAEQLATRHALLRMIGAAAYKVARAHAACTAAAAGTGGEEGELATKRLVEVRDVLLGTAAAQEAMSLRLGLHHTLWLEGRAPASEEARRTMLISALHATLGAVYSPDAAAAGGGGGAGGSMDRLLSVVSEAWKGVCEPAASALACRDTRQATASGAATPLSHVWRIEAALSGIRFTFADAKRAAAALAWQGKVGSSGAVAHRRLANLGEAIARLLVAERLWARRLVSRADGQVLWETVMSVAFANTLDNTVMFEAASSAGCVDAAAAAGNGNGGGGAGGASGGSKRRTAHRSAPNAEAAFKSAEQATLGRLRLNILLGICYLERSFASTHSVFFYGNAGDRLEEVVTKAKAQINETG